jgi:CDGSH-type Zn-finger protein
MSIVHDSEVAAPGTRFAFEYRFMEGKTSNDEVKDILAMICNCGVGSAKPFECGKFNIISATLENNARVAVKAKKN